LSFKKKVCSWVRSAFKFFLCNWFWKPVFIDKFSFYNFLEIVFLKYHFLLLKMLHLLYFWFF
jgi:hypothetical protein